jgi:hypothetical protein
MSTGDVVQGLPGTKSEPALVRCVREEHHGSDALHAPGRAPLHTSRVSSSADPRDGGSPSCSAKKGGSDAPIPPKAGPTEYVGGLNTKTLLLLVAHGEQYGKDSTSVELSQGGQENAPAALKRNGDCAQLSARGRGAKASAGRRLASGHPAPVRLTDGEAPVAQPGSAPQPELPVAEVGRSNRLGSSTSTDEQVTKVSAQLQENAGRPASVSDCLTGSAAAQPACFGRTA